MVCAVDRRTAEARRLTSRTRQNITDGSVKEIDNNLIDSHFLV